MLNGYLHKDQKSEIWKRFRPHIQSNAAYQWHRSVIGAPDIEIQKMTATLEHKLTHKTLSLLCSHPMYFLWLLMVPTCGLTFKNYVCMPFS